MPVVPLNSLGSGVATGEAAPVAYVAGVAGPLIGADLLHLKMEEIEQSAVGMASIGGAGTFDGSSSRALLLPSGTAHGAVSVQYARRPATA